MAKANTPDLRKRGTESTGFEPYVPDNANLPEFTWSALVLGAVLGIIFGASSLYLVLKVGLTVSASIPVAVISITLFRVGSKLFGIRKASILENNIVQTTGSAGESIAFGVGVTMPALMLLGYEMDIGRVMVVSILGGVLGILMMIPLRRAFIVKQHGKLKYPEGTACADVLIVGEQGGTSARTVFIGFGIAAVYYFLGTGLRLWKEYPAKALGWFKGAVPALEANPTLLGVGYIIGTRVSCIMVAGGVLSAFVLIPLIRMFGDGLRGPLYPGTEIISTMDAEGIAHAYVLYIGAGAVAAGGIVSLFQALPLIWSSLRSAWGDLRGGDAGPRTVARTDRDLPLWVVGAGSVALVFVIWSTTFLHNFIPWIPQLNMNIWGAILIVLFGFLFVTVSSRLTGEIGSSSNPISGMTVATLLLTCLIFLLLQSIDPNGNLIAKDLRLTALSIAAVVCIAASNGGTTSQDLKTGYLVGATPKLQQWAIVVGTISSALVIGFILVVLNQTATVYSTKNLPRLARPLDMTKLTELEQPSGDDKNAYRVWRAIDGNEQGVPPAKYLVDDQGQIKYLVDPGINGKLKTKDDGTEVQRYKAPKAALMALITDGILNRKLEWTLVLLGVSIALVLELSGVPALPFAVGVYLPLSSSTPIFVGGMVRWLVDRQVRNSGESEASETDNEMSPGVLLSTGYIAGGSIAGVVIAFLSFSETIPHLLATWQYRSVSVADSKPLHALYYDLAKREYGDALEDIAGADQALDVVAGKMVQELHRAANDPNSEITSDQLERLYLERNRLLPALGVAPNSDARTLDQGTRLARIVVKAKEIEELNEPELPDYIAVRKGTRLKLPNEKEPYEVPADGLLKDVVGPKIGGVRPALRVFDLNHDSLQLPTTLPKEATLKVPQRTWPSLLMFGLLTVILLLVGRGWLLKEAGATVKG